MLVNIAALQPYVPGALKYALKPYYRRLFPNRLYILLLPTFRCNYQCSYCTVVTRFNYGTLYPKGTEKSAAEWISALNRLPDASIYIAGGEPFVFAQLPELLNDLPSRHSVIGVVTNLSMPASVYRKIRKKLHLNVSFHREYVEANEFIDRIKELRDQFHIQVNIVATPENLPVLQQLSETMISENVTLHVDPLVDPEFRYTPEQRMIVDQYVYGDRVPDVQLNFEDFSRKRCSAGRNYVAVLPNGEVYTCAGGLGYVHSPLYAGIIAGREVPQFAMGNLFDSAFHLSKTDMTCALPCKEACDRDAARIRPA